MVMGVPTPSPVVTQGESLSDSEKAKALADRVEAQFKPGTVPISYSDG